MPIEFRGAGGGPDKSKGLTATAADILPAKTALVNGTVITGESKAITIRDGEGNIAEIPDDTPTAPYVSRGKTFINKDGVLTKGTGADLNNAGMMWTQSNQKSGNWSGITELTTGRIVAVSSSADYIKYSDDQGINWTQSNGTYSTWNTIMGLATGRLVAGSVNYGIWYSDDQGINWMQSNKTSGSWGVLIELANGRLVAGSGSSSGIIYSDDHGATWVDSNKKDGRWNTIIVLTTGRLVAGSSSSGIWYSDDQGINWTQSNKTSGSWNVPLELTTGRLISSDCEWSAAYGIWYSDDHGATWVVSNKKNSSFASFTELTTGRIVAGSANSGDCGIWYSDDKGINWTQSAITRFEWAYVIETSTGRLIATNKNTDAYGIIYSDDHGATWVNSTQKNGAWYFVAELSTGRLIACIQNGNKGIWYSDDPIAPPEWVDSSQLTIDQDGNLVQGTGRTVRILQTGTKSIAANFPTAGITNLPLTTFDKIFLSASHVLASADDTTIFRALSVGTKAAATQTWGLDLVTGTAASTVKFSTSGDYSNIYFNLEKKCSLLRYTVYIEN